MAEANTPQLKTFVRRDSSDLLVDEDVVSIDELSIPTPPPLPPKRRTVVAAEVIRLKSREIEMCGKLLADIASQRRRLDLLERESRERINMLGQEIAAVAVSSAGGITVQQIESSERRTRRRNNPLNSMRCIAISSARYVRKQMERLVGTMKTVKQFAT